MRKPVASVPRTTTTDILDRSRDYATIWPLHEGAAFKQGGRYYTVEGKRVRMPGEAVEAAPVAPRKGAKPAPVVAEDEQEPAEATDGDVVEGDVNLSAYAAGAMKYRFALVRTAILSRYSKAVVDEAQALEFLHEQGIVVAPELIASVA